MQTAELEQYLHTHIPLTKAMAVSVRSIDPDSVVLQAPLAPNINHRDTVFGGSAASLAVLAAWSLLLIRLRSEDLACRLVIQRNTMEYAQPIDGAFTARSSLERPERWSQFTRTLARRGRARIKVESEIEHNGRIAGRFSGEFVAISTLIGGC